MLQTSSIIFHMKLGDVQKLYQTATQHWPGVAWTLAAYREHLGMNCESSPSHPEDLYLAGAAGHRVQSAWLQIEEHFSLPTRQILKKQPTADLSVDDLWLKILVKLMDDDADYGSMSDGRTPARIIRYRGKVKLLHYFVVIGKRFAISRNRRKDQANVSMDQVARANEQPLSQRLTGDVLQASDDAALREELAPLRKILRDAFEGLDKQQQFLIVMVYGQQMKQKKAADLLSITESKASRLLSAAMEHLRQQLESVTDARDQQKFIHAWEQAVGQLLGEVGDKCDVTQ